MRYSYYSQKDWHWADKKIPGTNMTMKLWGCAITSLNMLAVYYGKNITPGEIMYKLKYTSGGAVIWNSLTELYPDIKFIERIKCPNTPAPISKIDSYLSSGYPVIAEVDGDYRKGGVQQHFIVLYAKQGDDYLMCDPYFEIEMGSFKAKYGNPSRYIYGLALYKGAVSLPGPPQTSPEPSQCQCTKELETINNLQNEISSLKDQINTDKALIMQLRAEKDEVSNALNNANEKIENLNIAKSEVEAKNKELKLENQNLTEKLKEVENLKVSLSSCETEKKELKETLEGMQASYEIVFPLFKDYAIVKIKGR